MRSANREKSRNSYSERKRKKGSSWNWLRGVLIRGWLSLVINPISLMLRIDSKETYYTGGYDPVVPPVTPPPDRIGATDALIRLSKLLRQLFLLSSLPFCFPKAPRKEVKKGKLY
ncbi:hypothetical protein M5K25_004388 [Dendrobium thyrsiflorum]|uniref:Uncharacterized protein n=1 Tax=Dendrobium thyrsiflorum TaxID=117978 RepID=A0ABD0VTH5_DENTH